MAYARSSANLLTKLVLEDNNDSFRWEVSISAFVKCCPLIFSLWVFLYFYKEFLMRNFHLQCLFRTPLNNFDAVVLLHRDKLTHPKRILFASESKQGMFIRVPELAWSSIFLLSPLLENLFSTFFILCSIRILLTRYMCGKGKS